MYSDTSIFEFPSIFRNTIQTSIFFLNGPSHIFKVLLSENALTLFCMTFLKFPLISINAYFFEWYMFFKVLFRFSKYNVANFQISNIALFRLHQGPDPSFQHSQSSGLHHSFIKLFSFQIPVNQGKITFKYIRIYLNTLS